MSLPIIFEDVYSNLSLPPNALVVTSFAETSKRTSIRATPNRWAQRNNSLKNTAARQAASAAVNDSAKKNDGTSVVWTTKTSSSLSANNFNYRSSNNISSNISNSGDNVPPQRDRSTNSNGSVESESLLNAKKKRLSKFRPESLLLLGSGSLGGAWQQQQLQISDGGVDYRGVQVAFDAPDCQLVGYKKMNRELAPPLIELGTLSKVPDSSSSSGSSSSFRRSESGGSLGNNGGGNLVRIGGFTSYLGDARTDLDKNTADKNCNNATEIVNNNNNNDGDGLTNRKTQVSSTSSAPPAPIVPTPSSTSPAKNSHIYSSSLDVTLTSQPPYISPSTQLHHQKTSSFLFSASSLPALNKDDEDDDEGDLSVMNDSCLLVAGAAGGSLPELVGGSDASGLSRSEEGTECIVANQKISPSLDVLPPCRSPSIRSLPIYSNKQPKPAISSQSIPKTNVFQALNRNQGTGDLSILKLSSDIHLLQSTSSTSAIGSEQFTKSDEGDVVFFSQSLGSNKDSGYDTLKHLAEEYKKGIQTLRDSFSKMPDLSIESTEIEDTTLEDLHDTKDFEEVSQMVKDQTDKSASPASTCISKQSLSSSSFSSNASFPRRESRTMQISSHFHSQLINRRLVSKVTDQTVRFSHAKENLRKAIGYQGHFYRSVMVKHLNLG